MYLSSQPTVQNVLDLKGEKGTKSQRSPLDFYPTPSNVTHVAMRWLLNAGMRGPMLDPAAGEGDLISAARDLQPEEHWSAIEINDNCASKLEMVAENVIIADARKVQWPSANVLSNPPFSLLDDFWNRACVARREIGCWVGMLAPVAWFSAEKRSGYVKPDAILQLGWRPVFRVGKIGPAHKGSQDFVWLVLRPVPQVTATWERFEKT